ncbi:MAG: glycoside hydrolase family 3 protein [Acidobacteria bacterium]|nr:glycoside hydrolase family 3 protein [Acidobacteriota bacterium]
MAGRDIEALIAELTLEEKVSMTHGADMWRVAGVDRLGIPAIKVTDGPNGARGGALFGGGASSACIPCGSALGATFNPDLVERAGAMLGVEAHTKQSRVLLAPTINMHRSPLYGRNFECYSEDPYLSGQIAAAFVRGVQSQGVATTPKHFVGNETEFQRHTIDSIIDERTLREIYLVPFEAAVVEGGALGLMTAYNRLNGSYSTENEWLLRDVLKGEWGFEGFVVTDWLAAGSTVKSARAGLDLEMPGPGAFYGGPLVQAVESGEVDLADVDEIVRRHLHVIDVLDAWDDAIDDTEVGVDTPEHHAIAYEAAVESIVLLTNDGVLPLAENVASVALIGPNAGVAHIMGGGSAKLNAHYETAPLEPLAQRLGARVRHEPGCVIDKTTPAMSRRDVVRPDGEPGFAVEFFATDDFSGDVVATLDRPNSDFVWFGSPTAGVPAEGFSARARGTLMVTESGEHQFTLSQAGRCRVIVDGHTILDGVENPPPRGGGHLFGAGSEEVSAHVTLEAGTSVAIEIEYSSREASVLYGAKIGYGPPRPPDLMDRAVRAASESDVAIVVVGTSSEWESEGHDRDVMDLPGEQVELIERVTAVNERTVVVVNAGAAVEMSWIDQPAAVLQSWLGGQEMANALDSILFGEAEPAGRLPITIPERIEHTPAYGQFPGENDRSYYGEGLLMGYRWYDTRRLPVRFGFGHGLSYTTFEWGAPVVSTPDEHGNVNVEVQVTNTGDRAGAEVVQVYVSPRDSRLFRPDRELKGFGKLHLDAGEIATAVIDLDARSFAHWDPVSVEADEIRARPGYRGGAVPSGTDERPARPGAGWYVDAGEYEIQVCRCLSDVVDAVTVEFESELGPLVRS